jgi:hydroxymethylbilane synthase
MLPAVGQGAIGLQLRADDAATAAFIAALDDPDTDCRVTAERACLEVLDGSCRTPIAAHARLAETGDELSLEALVALPDGSEVHRVTRSGPRETAVALGRAAGEALKAAAGEDFLARLAAE